MKELTDDDIEMMKYETNARKMNLSGEKLYFEIQRLKEYFGNNQGIRTDLKNGSKSKKRNDDTETKISKILGISKGTISQLETIARWNPEYLKEITNHFVRTNTVYEKVKREMNLKNE